MRTFLLLLIITLSCTNAPTLQPGLQPEHTPPQPEPPRGMPEGCKCDSTHCYCPDMERHLKCDARKPPEEPGNACEVYEKSAGHDNWYERAGQGYLPAERSDLFPENCKCEGHRCHCTPKEVLTANTHGTCRLKPGVCDYHHRPVEDERWRAGGYTQIRSAACEAEAVAGTPICRWGTDTWGEYFTSAGGGQCKLRNEVKEQDPCLVASADECGKGVFEKCQFE